MRHNKNIKLKNKRILKTRKNRKMFTKTPNVENAPSVDDLVDRIGKTKK